MGRIYIKTLDKPNEKIIEKEIKARKLFPRQSLPIIKTEENLRIFMPEAGMLEQPNNQDLYRIGQNLAKIHLMDLSESQEWPDKLLKRYEALPEMERSIIDAAKLIGSIKIGWIHGDMRLKNITKFKKKIVFIDWEFLGKNFIYWDVAIFLADIRHSQFHGRNTNLKLEYFIDGYTESLRLSTEELKFCYILGANDIVFDHLQGDSEKPINGVMFEKIESGEREFMLGER